MCYAPIKLGITNDVLNAMDEKEREFWVDFLREGKDLIDSRNSEGACEPFTPTDSLREKYQCAINEYNGARYCQVQSLRRIFAL